MLDAWVCFACSQSKEVADACRPPPGEPPFVLVTIEMTCDGVSYFSHNGKLHRARQEGRWNFKEDLMQLCRDETGKRVYEVQIKTCQRPTLATLV